MWVYHQLSGHLYSPDGILICSYGYSGKGVGKNNPALQHLKRVGPIPRGLYTIGIAYKHPVLGILTMNLYPYPENEMFHRGSFRIHGDSFKDPGNASNGCPVFPSWVRRQISESKDKVLQVV